MQVPSPGGGNGNPLPVFLSGESHGQGSLVGYSPWGCKELDMTEVTQHGHTHTITMNGIMPEVLKNTPECQKVISLSGSPLNYSDTF